MGQMRLGELIEALMVDRALYGDDAELDCVLIRGARRDGVCGIQIDDHTDPKVGVPHGKEWGD